MKKETKPKEPKQDSSNPKVLIKDTKNRPLNLKPNRFRHPIKYRQWRKGIYEKMLITIRLKNGYRHMKIVFVHKNNSFMYNKGAYVIDKDYAYFNPDMAIYCLDYHEDISVPIDTSINIEEIKKAIKNNGAVSNIEHSLNPSLLADFQVSTVIEKLLKGDQIDLAIGKLTRLVLFNLIISIINVMSALRIFGVL